MTSPEELARKVREPLLTREQQEELSRAAAEALANLAEVVQPFARAMQELAAIAIPAFKAALEPFVSKLKEFEE